MTIETTIKDGLPVYASGEVCSAEPDVGIMSQFVEDLEVVFRSGYPVPGELSDEDDQRIVNELVSAFNDLVNSSRISRACRMQDDWT